MSSFSGENAIEIRIASFDTGGWTTTSVLVFVEAELFPRDFATSAPTTASAASAMMTARSFTRGSGVGLLRRRDRVLRGHVRDRIGARPERRGLGRGSRRAAHVRLEARELAVDRRVGGEVGELLVDLALAGELIRQRPVGHQVVDRAGTRLELLALLPRPLDRLGRLCGALADPRRDLADLGGGLRGLVERLLGLLLGREVADPLVELRRLRAHDLPALVQLRELRVRRVEVRLDPDLALEHLARARLVALLEEELRALLRLDGVGLKALRRRLERLLLGRELHERLAKLDLLLAELLVRIVERHHRVLELVDLLREQRLDVEDQTAEDGHRCDRSLESRGPRKHMPPGGVCGDSGPGDYSWPHVR